MSRDEPTVRGYAVTHPAGSAALPTDPAWDQFVHTAEGTITVTVPGAAWTVPPDRALWLPAGHPVAVANRSRAAVRILYLHRSIGALTGPPRVVDLPRFARELVRHAVRVCPLSPDDDPVQAALVTVLLDQVRGLLEAPLRLPLPSEARAAAVAEAVRVDPAVDLTLLARRLGVGRRTLERLFPAETGMALGAWCRRAKVLRAVELLAGGETVTATGTAVGYSTPSAFVAAFRRELGTTPTRFLTGP